MVNANVTNVEDVELARRGTAPSLDDTLQVSTWRTRVAILLAGLTIVRVVLISTFQIADGEAYYFTWARFPAWSYYDHPPLLAWMAWLGAHISQTQFAIRVGPVLCATVFGLLVYRLGEKLFSPRAGFVAVVLLSVLPSFMVTSFALNPESPLAPLWVGALLLLDDMRDHDEPWRPWVLGLAIGFAFLAKYTGLLLVGVSLAYLASSAHTRRWLRRPSLYFGALVALVVALPVIVWNAERGWPSLALHFVERRAPFDFSTLLGNVVHVFGVQWAAYHPLFFPGALAAIVMTIRRSKLDDRYRLLALASYPVLAFLFVAMICVHDPEPHWTMVGYMSLAVAAGGWLDERLDSMPTRLQWYLRIGVGMSIAAGIFVLVYSKTPRLRDYVPNGGKNDLFTEVTGWDEVDAAIHSESAALGDNVVVASCQYALCAHLLTELGDEPRVYCPTLQRTAFDFWERRQPPDNATVLYVTNEHYHDAPSAVMPDRVCRDARDVSIKREGREIQTYHLSACAPRESVQSSSGSAMK